VVDFTPPPGWKLNFGRVNVRFSPAVENRMRVLVTPPEGFPADAELTATTTIAGTVLKTTTRLHPVPSLRVRHVAEALAVGTDDTAAAWAALPVHSIPHTRTWQGTVTNAADCSGGFRIAHDGATLFVEVRVHDDVVVGNIAPDDIKGHWRSDSVGLCNDPEGGAEHPLGRVQAGLFPYRPVGRVWLPRRHRSARGAVPRRRGSRRCAAGMQRPDRGCRDQPAARSSWQTRLPARQFRTRASPHPRSARPG